MAYVHYNRNTIVVLTRDRNPTLHSNSHVWVSKDYGHTFQNRTASFMVDNNAYALIDMLYPSPVDYTKVSVSGGFIACSAGIILMIHFKWMINGIRIVNGLFR